MAQNPHPYFRNYTTDDGLPSPEVHYAIQDTAGYMWFGTDNGLSRFDGYSFKNYGPREGLKDHVVFFMQKDPEGMIWVATMRGNLYFIAGDTIRPFPGNNIIQTFNEQGAFLTDFYIDAKGCKYLSFYGLGILKFPTEGRHHFISMDSTSISSFALRIEERWITSSSRGVPSRSRNPKLRGLKITLNYMVTNVLDTLWYFSVPYPNDSINTAEKFSIELSKDQILTLSTSDHTLSYFNQSKVEWVKKLDHHFELKALLQEESNQILLGLLNGGGLYRYEDVSKIPINTFHHFLDGQSITHIYRDLEGAYWMSTVENGIFYCPDLDITIYDHSAGLPQDHISAIDFISDQELLLGFRNGTAGILNLQKNQFKHFPTIPSVPDQIIFDIWYDQQRKRIYATNGRLHQLQDKHWQEHLPPYPIRNAIGKRLTADRRSGILYGTNFNGFGYLSLDQPSQSFHSTTIDFSTRTLRVWEDYSRRIWLGTINGLFLLDASKVVQPSFLPGILKSNRIEDIAQLSDSTLVFATKGQGLILWKDDYLHQLTTQEGLVSDMLENVHVDASNQIWVGTLEGLSKIVVNKSFYSIENYTTFHGLPSNEITRVHSMGDQVWVATTKGLYKWRAIQKRRTVAPPILEQIRVNGAFIDPNTQDCFTHDNNDLTFRFLSINYQQDGQIPYRYQLNKQGWRNTESRSVNFARLAPGDYQFEVQAQNQDGIWSASRQYHFEIRPAFWQTWWFITLVFGILLAMVWQIYRSRLRQIQRKAAIDKELNDLQRSALRAQMNPHFIFNCLNSIQNFIVKNDQTNATRYLAQFSRLVRGVLNASLQTQISLAEELQLLTTYLTLEKLRFKEKFDFQIKVDPKIEQFDTLIPPLLTQPFVENAIVHGFASTKKGGQLDILVSPKASQLEIRIRDNGIGIYQSQLKNGRRLTSNGVGMSISQKRLFLASELNQYDVSELLDEAGKVVGTEVRLLLAPPQSDASTPADLPR